MSNNISLDPDQVERIEIEVVGKGWVVTHEKPHCTLGLKQKREVFLDAQQMIYWIMNCLDFSDNEISTREINKMMGRGTND